MDFSAKIYSCPVPCRLAPVPSILKTVNSQLKSIHEPRSVGWAVSLLVPMGLRSQVLVCTRGKTYLLIKYFLLFDC